MLDTEITDLKRPKLENNHSLSKVELRFKKISEHATTPTRGSSLAAGYDLYAAYDDVIPSKGRTCVKTDIQIALPNGCYGRVAPRSGLALKHGIDVGAGVIDQDYRGNVGVVLFNFGDEDFKTNTVKIVKYRIPNLLKYEVSMWNQNDKTEMISKGDRIAQLICEKIFIPDLVECEDLDETERGANGYGSTGV